MPVQTQKNNDILSRIIENKRKEVDLTKKKMPLESFVSELTKSKRSFADAISHSNNHDTDDDAPHLIAEIKPASPSSGNIRSVDNIELLRITAIYNRYADAISVLTDKKYFGGDIKNLQIVSRSSKIPVLRKDFIIDAYQIYESRHYGADAILLIASVLDVGQITEYMQIAKKLKMASLVEVHNNQELEIALKATSSIIGINNRDLSAMEVSLGTTHELIKFIPEDKIIVSESGIKTHSDMSSLGKAGVDAVLVGTAIMSGDIEKNIRQLRGL